VELMDVYSRDSLRAFLVKLPPTLVAKESGVSFDTHTLRKTLGVTSVTSSC
jgi:hypothetical protein